MKILFLDVDGVLNNSKNWKGSKAKNLDPDCLDQLRRIVETTHCKIVLESDWRCLPEATELDKKLAEFGLEIFGTTACDKPVPIKCEEINHYLQDNKGLDIEKFAIVDDQEFAGFLHPTDFFLTSRKDGLTNEIANQVIAHLI